MDCKRITFWYCDIWQKRNFMRFVFIRHWMKWRIVFIHTCLLKSIIFLRVELCKRCLCVIFSFSNRHKIALGSFAFGSSMGLQTSSSFKYFNFKHETPFSLYRAQYVYIYSLIKVKMLYSILFSLADPSLLSLIALSFERRKKKEITSSCHSFLMHAFFSRLPIYFHRTILIPARNDRFNSKWNTQQRKKTVIYTLLQ